MKLVINNYGKLVEFDSGYVYQILLNPDEYDFDDLDSVLIIYKR